MKAQQKVWMPPQGVGPLPNMPPQGVGPLPNVQHFPVYISLKKVPNSNKYLIYSHLKKPQFA